MRKEAYESLTYQFVLQDVENCIQIADVFISNKGMEYSENTLLKWDIIRNVCLMLYPGLVQPTPIERCMQIAFSAKANSGCISRQVGAVVTDSDYNILSIGWNDVPCGDVSCSRKNLKELCNSYSHNPHTDYEFNTFTEYELVSCVKGLHDSYAQDTVRNIDSSFLTNTIMAMKYYNKMTGKKIQEKQKKTCIML